MNYLAPWWLPDGHSQTIWPALFSRRVRDGKLPFKRERWSSPDADFVDVDRLSATHADAPLLVLFHGLEGSSQSHYSQAFGCVARSKGWAFAVPHFRGCSGELNLAPRAYHSGDHEEIGWLLARFRAEHQGPIFAVGVSLGGNALPRWAGEAQNQAARLVSAVTAISSPLDLTISGHAIGKGFNRHVYTRMFLRSMLPKATSKWEQYPGLFDLQRLRAARDLYEFDDIFTAPLHGFANTKDYWSRASAKPVLASIRVPALAVNALNDPFVPAVGLPTIGEVGSCVTLWQPAQGGHVGFAGAPFPGHVFVLPQAVCEWLCLHIC